MDSHGADGEHSHTGTASDTWLNFAQAARQAEALAATMQCRLPDLRAQIDTALPALVADLDALDAEARGAVAGLQGTTILATHPRHRYFARAYGLDIAAFDWDAGAMPDHAQWQALEDLATRTGAGTLIWEAAPPPAAMAKAVSMGLKSVIFAPLAGRLATGDFLSLMRAQIAALSAPG